MLLRFCMQIPELLMQHMFFSAACHAHFLQLATVLGGLWALEYSHSFGRLVGDRVGHSTETNLRCVRTETNLRCVRSSEIFTLALIASEISAFIEAQESARQILIVSSGICTPNLNSPSYSFRDLSVHPEQESAYLIPVL